MSQSVARQRHAVYSHPMQRVISNADHLIVVVRVEMPHVAKYGKDPVMDLTYASSQAVRPGQTVLVPPTRINDKWSRGKVLAVHAADSAEASTLPDGYRGRIKYIKPLPSRNRR